jgi:hypothetical protein
VHSEPGRLHLCSLAVSTAAPPCHSLVTQQVQVHAPLSLTQPTSTLQQHRVSLVPAAAAARVTVRKKRVTVRKKRVQSKCVAVGVASS